MQEKTFREFDIPLHDIKPIVEIEEYSLYYLLGLIGLGIIILGLIVYGVYIWYKKRNAFNLRKNHLQLIHDLDLSDTKNAAYGISSYGLTFKDDSPRHKEMYENITQRLEGYKYKKDVDAFDSETLGHIEIYKDMLDA